MCVCVYVFLSVVCRASPISLIVLLLLLYTATISFVILVTVIFLLRLCLRAADGSYLSCQFYYLCACFV